MRVIIGRRAKKIMQRLPQEQIRRIGAAIDGLSENPRPHDCKKLRGYENLYRIRVGKWCISYAVEDEALIVVVLEISPRGGAYRHL